MRQLNLCGRKDATFRFTADVSAVDSLENKAKPDPLGPAELYFDTDIPDEDHYTAAESGREVDDVFNKEELVFL